MKFPRRQFLHLAASAAALSALPSIAKAQTYPTRPITIVDPFPPGGSISIVARIIADKLSEPLGQRVVVDQRGGASGTLGARQVARSAPDGYTLMLGFTGTLAIAPSLYPNAGYDPRKDFAPIGMIGMAPTTLIAHPSFPVHSIAELIVHARQSPGKVNFASPGVGTVGHIAGELLMSMSGIQLSHVPYRVSGQVMTDVLGGHVPLGFVPVPVSYESARNGLIRMLGVTSLKRSSLLPEVPTFAEQVWRVLKPCCATAWSRQPARRVRSSSGSTRSCAPRSAATISAPGLRSSASSRWRRPRRSTLPKSTARRPNGRHS
jgi:tripartite-type tricarboxylate transporter receptor subunit TctC